nr:2-amino-4-hydroxy-6-hydroxymethyldihydropteridine diphosphokinase [Delftia sp. PS-11]
MAQPPVAMTEAGRWVAIGLGANLGDRGRALAMALLAMDALPGTRLVAVSSLYSTAPVDSSGPDYLNAVAAVRTTLAPLALLDALQAIELAAGRERPYRNAPRTLDLDIELWEDECIRLPRLCVPHPRMHERAFVLVPLAEIAPWRVTLAQLQAVAGQGIRMAEGAGWHLQLQAPAPAA